MMQKNCKKVLAKQQLFLKQRGNSGINRMTTWNRKNVGISKASHRAAVKAAALMDQDIRDFVTDATLVRADLVIQTFKNGGDLNALRVNSKCFENLQDNEGSNPQRKTTQQERNSNS